MLPSVLGFVKQDVATWFNGTMVVSLLQGFSPDTYYRIGLKYIVEFEDSYSKSVEEYLVKKYKLDVQNIFNENGIDSKISDIVDDKLVNSLVSYQPKFTEIKRRLKVQSMDQLDMLRKIIKINTYQTFSDEDIESDYIETLMNIPDSVLDGVKRNDLVIGYNIEFRASKFTGEPGIFAKSDQNEYEQKVSTVWDQALLSTE